ncbi:ubiquinone biosynthesis accessory factor UbiJ [Colwellia psychrerythraea]|uniref:Ubiquinone biosynthesis accessory factor UbiJ n=1 Tax=Colwellia psychrerythraea TaxID=28229 RepID=A0A099KPN2_COLPS|nr:SCP2 sterol-binding domain-containing protein [Colwellia psychrerythraea]KGJ92719.1 Sterol-binding domain protein [Colwellia psychrerythraea]
MAPLHNQAVTKISNDLLLTQVVTATLELIINKALSLNNKSVSFAAVAQKTLTLNLAELPFSLSFTLDNTSMPASIIVRSGYEYSDCTINTSVNTLKKLKTNVPLTQLIKRDELDVSGDIKIAQQFSNIALSLDIDWQTELAKHIGDVPTHKLLQFGNKITKSLSSTGKQLEADISEYLVHEKRLVVTNSQLNAFNQMTKDVASEVDALSARIDKLIADTAGQ